MRSSQLSKILVKSLWFFISIYGWGILLFSGKLCTTHQVRHNEESLTLMTTLSTQEACSGGQLKVEKHFFPSSFSVKGRKRQKCKLSIQGSKIKQQSRELQMIPRRNKKWHNETKEEHVWLICLPAMAMASFWPGGGSGRDVLRQHRGHRPEPSQQNRSKLLCLVQAPLSLRLSREEQDNLLCPRGKCQPKKEGRKRGSECS